MRPAYAMGSHATALRNIPCGSVLFDVHILRVRTVRRDAASDLAILARDDAPGGARLCARAPAVGSRGPRARRSADGGGEDPERAMAPLRGRDGAVAGGNREQHDG